MTQLFDPESESSRLTVIEAGPCPVVQVRKPETDGYEAFNSLSAGCRAQDLESELGHLRKTAPRASALVEFRARAI